jgi:hypothetical protein
MAPRKTVREICKTVRKILRQSELADAELALFQDGDLDALASNGFLTVRAFQNANPDLWEALLPGRAALWGILRHQFGASLAGISNDDSLNVDRVQLLRGRALFLCWSIVFELDSDE